MYQTLLFEEDIGDAAALVRTMVRFAGRIKGAEDCPIEIHDTTRFYPTGQKNSFNHTVLSLMTTGATWYGGLLPGLMPARKSRHEPPFYCERDYRADSTIDVDEVARFNAMRDAIVAGPMEELRTKWSCGERRVFYEGGGYGDCVSKFVGPGIQPLTEWWILPAAAVRAFCAKARRTRKMRRATK